MSVTRRRVLRIDQPDWRGAPLETELSRALKRLKTVRDRKLVARHLGWDGRPPGTLTEAGARFGLTRERARQVYAAALPLLRQCDDMPALDAVLAVVRKRRHERVSDVEQDLQALGFTKRRCSLQGVLRAAHVFDRAPGFQLHPVGGVLFVGAVSNVARTILSTAVRTVVHQGAARVTDLCRIVSERLGHKIDKDLVRRILETRSDISWLDDAGEWFWLTSIPRNRVLTRVQKVLAVHPRIRVSTLHEAVSRAYKPLSIPEPVLRSLCATFPWCRVGGQHVEASVVPKLEEFLSRAEAIICRILRDHGGAMPLQQLQTLCLASGVKKENLWRILSFSPMLRRFGKEMYGLIGAEVEARPLSRSPRESAS